MLDDRQKYENQISSSKSKKFWSIVGGLGITTAVYTGAFLLKDAVPAAFIPGLLLGSAIDTSLEHEENAMNLATRFENIKNDLLLGAKYRRKSTSTPKVEEQDLADVKATPNPTYQQQVDAYVESLAKGENDTHKEFIKLM